jgi:glutamine cyclotransferase
MPLRINSKLSSIAAFLICILIFTFQLVLANGQKIEASCSDAKQISYKIVRIIQRSVPGFTQGLIYKQGRLLESTGLYQQSALNEINLESGVVRRLLSLPPQFFAEGFDHWNGTDILLTWKEKTLFIWTTDLSAPPSLKSYPYEGWGITHSDENWITSDGSSLLYFLDPETFEASHSLQVRELSRAVSGINELEWVEGKVFANLYPTDQIVRIDPKTGCIDGKLNFSFLKAFFSPQDEARISSDQDLVLNGIAYDSDQELLYITGKNWPLIFQLHLE